ncbi:hypothetical protein E2C01_050966 [Portunus trituberculatus]|uniref:Uncharacterized protein n=1 Tax=Portunus trituberculatus TaxID=210409 RepID=A0A5B7GIX6_PORTR|nr:hypothetical protein [Portunus trituberculatus]
MCGELRGLTKAVRCDPLLQGALWASPCVVRTFREMTGQMTRYDHYCIQSSCHLNHQNLYLHVSMAHTFTAPPRVITLHAEIHGCHLGNVLTRVSHLAHHTRASHEDLAILSP